MNILYTITSYPPAIGGTQLYTHQLAAHFLRARNAVKVVTFWDQTRHDWLWGTTLSAHPEPREYCVDGVSVHRLGLTIADKIRILPAALGYWFLEGPAIRHISRLVAAKLEAIEGDWQLVHNVRQGREALSFASLKLARSLGVPFVLTPVHHPRWGGWLHRHFQALYRTADAVIALTNSEKQTLVDLGVSEERVHVTGMGPVLSPSSDADGFRQKAGLGLDPVVLFLGTHFPYKGLQTLVLAAEHVWKIFPSARFVFAGTPTSFSRRLFARRPDPRFLHLGAVDLQAKTDALAACNLLCVPSTQESFGGVYVEAWAMGKPVIAADIPATREVVSDGIDGYLVPADPLALARTICALLAEPALQKRMGEAGRQKVRAKYTWERLAERTEQVYRHVLQAGPAPAAPEEGTT